MPARYKSEGPTDIVEPATWIGTYTGEVMGVYNYRVAHSQRSLVGQDIPDFHKRRAAGELLPMTTFEQLSIDGEILESEITTRKAAYTTTNGYHHWIGKRELTDKWLITPSQIKEIANRYDALPHVQEAAGRIMSAGHDSLTFVVELGKIVAMFRRFVFRLLENVRKRKFEDIWLEGRFGWRTLVYDMIEINDAVESLNDLRSRFSSKAGSSDDFEETFTHVIDWTDSITTIQFTDTVSVSLRGAVVADVSPSSFRTSLPATSWEIIPFSFVVDWLFTVGSTIDALSLLTFSEDVVASAGYKVTLVRTGRIADTNWQSDWHGSRTWSTTCTGNYTVRVPTAIPKTPRYRFNLYGLKVVDLAALVLQATRRRK